MTTKSNSNYNKSMIPNNLLDLSKEKDKENINNKALILPNFNKHKTNKSKSVIKINNSFFKNLLNDNNSKIDNISLMKDIEGRKELKLSGELFYGKRVIITPNGLKNNFMKRKERSTYFGIKNLHDFSGNPYNHYLINYKNNNNKNRGSFREERIKEDIENIKNNNKNYVSEEKSTRVFKIYYDKDNDEYKFIYLETSLLLYYQVENKFILSKIKNIILF